MLLRERWGFIFSHLCFIGFGSFLWVLIDMVCQHRLYWFIFCQHWYANIGNCLPTPPMCDIFCLIIKIPAMVFQIPAPSICLYFVVNVWQNRKMFNTFSLLFYDIDDLPTLRFTKYLRYARQQKQKVMQSMERESERENTITILAVVQRKVGRHQSSKG